MRFQAEQTAHDSGELSKPVVTPASENGVAMAYSFYDLLQQYQRHAQAGELTESLEAARRMWDAFPDRRNYTWTSLAAAHSAMGEDRLVAQVLRQALDANALWRLSLLEVPELELVRTNPECQAVIEEARRRIEAKHYRPFVVVEQPPHGGIAPMLLSLHGANSNAVSELSQWRAASTLGWIVAAGQSSQPSAEDRFCWDPPPERIWQDLREIASMLPGHARVVLAGFSQGAWVALQAALRSDIFQPAGVIMVAPFLGAVEHLEPSGRRLRIAMVLGEEDALNRQPSLVIDALAARGHHVETIRPSGLGHAYPDDFAEQLPHLLELVTRLT
jgi:predicted esterase